MSLYQAVGVMMKASDPFKTALEMLPNKVTNNACEC